MKTKWYFNLRKDDGKTNIGILLSVGREEKSCGTVYLNSKHSLGGECLSAGSQNSASCCRPMGWSTDNNL